MDTPTLAKLLDELPRSPGVYLMRDKDAEILYIGKAKDLRARVRSYFNPQTSDTRHFVSRLSSIVEDIEVVLTSSEKEALLLENNLIKIHSPRFNVRLRDDKDYLCIRLDLKKDWPRLEIVRRPKKDGAVYFGPYHSAQSARQTVKLVRRYFKLRNCSDRMMASRNRPCLQYQIHRCPGPCVYDVNPEEYRAQVEYARLFLLGRRDELVEELAQRMTCAAAELDFERAAALRDQIRAVERTLTPQTVDTPGGEDLDAIGFFRDGTDVQLAVMEFRGGRLTGRVEHHFGGQELPDEEILSSFIVQNYREDAATPADIALPFEIESASLIADILGDVKGKKVRVSHPRRGPRLARLELAQLNAKQLLETRLGRQGSVETRLEEIQKRLRLPRPPKRIECVDISHLSGTDTVGAIACVRNGSAERGAGRTYKVQTVDDGDDFRAMKEVLSRRFERAREGQQGWEPPDLLVVDGGRGQLAVALAVLEELHIEDQPVVALAKERAGRQNAATDRIYLVGRKNPIPVTARTSPLQILTLARDEAHRLAVRFQRVRRSKRTKASPLDEVPGIGPKTKAALLKEIGSLKRIREASVDRLAQVPGVGPKLAQRILETLG